MVGSLAIAGGHAVNDDIRVREELEEGCATSLAVAPLAEARFTSISAAIDFARATFENNGFEGERQVIDISGDGPNNIGRLAPEARDSAVRQGITINGLPIINDRPNRLGYPVLPNLDLYYENCVIGGPGAFVVVAHGFPAFAAAIRRKMIIEIAGGFGGRPWPPRPRPIPVRLDGNVPPCDIGERQLEEFLRNQPDWPY